MWEEKSAAVAVRVEKSRRAVATARRPANEFDAVSVANFFGFAQEEAGDLAGVGDVGSTARGEIEIVNVDEAKLVAVGGRKFAQAEAGCFVASDEADIDGTILEDEFRWPGVRRIRFDPGRAQGVEIVDLQNQSSSNHRPYGKRRWAC